MQFRYPAKVYILISALCVMAAGFTLSRLASAAAYQDSYPFQVQFTRLAPVRPWIANTPRIGYLSNVPDEEDAFVRLYFPTQYVLAPTLLVPLHLEPEADLVLGNFTRQEDYHALGRQHGLEVVREFPMGVVLYRRAGTQGGQAQ